MLLGVVFFFFILLYIFYVIIKIIFNKKIKNFIGTVIVDISKRILKSKQEVSAITAYMRKRGISNSL
jgi:hypothetical protein